MLQQYINQEIPDVQAMVRKGRGTREQIANTHWIIEKAKEFQKKKKIYFCFTDYAKPLIVWITTKCGTFLKRWEYQNIVRVFWENFMQVKKQQLEQWTGLKLGKEYIKAVYCYQAYLTYLQSTSCKAPGWMKHKLDSRFPGEISTVSDIWKISP